MAAIVAIVATVVPLVARSGHTSATSKGTGTATATATQAAAPAATASAADPGHTPTASAPSPGPASAGGPAAGEWQVTYALPATVTITLAGGVYTESAKTQVQLIPGLGCYLPVGAVLATFTPTGPGVYAGHAYVWSKTTCTISGTTPMTVGLSSDGNTLVSSLTNGAGIPPTLVFMRTQQ